MYCQVGIYTSQILKGRAVKEYLATRIASYVPSWLPEDYFLRVWVNLGLDLVTLASLFVLGGDFWDKVRALFLHDARARTFGVVGRGHWNVRTALGGKWAATQVRDILRRAAHTLVSAPHFLL
jgi:hypothetical protein